MLQNKTDQPIINNSLTFNAAKQNWPTNHKQYNSVKGGKGNEKWAQFVVGHSITGRAPDETS